MENHAPLSLIAALTPLPPASQTICQRGRIDLDERRRKGRHGPVNASHSIFDGRSPYARRELDRHPVAGQRSRELAQAAIASRHSANQELPAAVSPFHCDRDVRPDTLAVAVAWLVHRALTAQAWAICVSSGALRTAPTVTTLVACSLSESRLRCSESDA